MALGNTPHIRFFLDKDGQLYVLDQDTKQKQLISMRQNRDGTKTSRALAAEIENLSWEFRWDHQKRGAEKKRQEEEAASALQDEEESEPSKAAAKAEPKAAAKAEPKAAAKAEPSSESLGVNPGRQKVTRPKSARFSHLY